MIVPSCGELRELKSGHYHKVVEITDHAGQCLSQEYMVRTLCHMRENLCMLFGMISTLYSRTSFLQIFVTCNRSMNHLALHRKRELSIYQVLVPLKSSKLLLSRSY